jgi:hypothetical protein
LHFAIFNFQFAMVVSMRRIASAAAAKFAMVVSTWLAGSRE